MSSFSRDQQKERMTSSHVLSVLIFGTYGTKNVPENHKKKHCFNQPLHTDSLIMPAAK